MESFLSGKIFWSYDHEVSQISIVSIMSTLLSGSQPFHTHEGEIVLTNTGIFITGDVEIQISIGELEQISLGFDEVFNRTLTRNAGLFWQPLRIRFNEQTIYAIIDYNMFGSKNKLWFDTLKQILSD